ncbi:MAG: Cys-tRNA(Pro) deacylase [Phormidesmis sp.]
MKTNAARLLDSSAIPYEVLNYNIDLNDLTATSTAQKLGLPTNQVFKTLVVKGDQITNLGSIAFAVIPGDHQLDLKLLAKLSGHRKIEPVPLKQVQPLTGYVRGGVTALAAKKTYPVFLDEWAQAYDRIAVSSGIRGQMLMLKTTDYTQITQAVVGAIAKPLTT